MRHYDFHDHDLVHKITGNKLRTISRGEVLAAALELKEDYGEGLTLTAFRRETGFSQHLIFDLFGNWKKLRTMIGLEPMAPRARRKFNDKEIVNHLRRLAAERGPNLTQWDFCRAIGTSHAEIGRRFGSWGNLRVMAGLTRRITRPLAIPDRELLDDVLQVYLRVGSLHSMSKHKFYGGKYSISTIRQRFHSARGIRLHFMRHLREYFRSLDPAWKPGDPWPAGARSRR